jgi:hypothetical protein
VKLLIAVFGSSLDINQFDYHAFIEYHQIINHEMNFLLLFLLLVIENPSTEQCAVLSSFEQETNKARPSLLMQFFFHFILFYESFFLKTATISSCCFK